MSDTSNALISVIVPVYNVENYINKCVDSILSQEYGNLEVILVDDGSSDRSGQICDDYAEKDARVVVIHQVNSGVSAARNAAIAAVRGDYVGFVDSDDFVDPDMYKVMLETAAEHGSDIVECNLHHNFPDYEDTEIMEKIYDRKQLLCHGRYVLWNKLYSIDLIKRADTCFPDGLFYEDLEYFAKLIPHVRRYDYVDIVPYHYVQRTISINNYSTLKTTQVFKILGNILEYYKKNNFYDEYRDALEYLFARILLCSSFSRICFIKDKTERKMALADNWKTLADAFPGWRGNSILKEQRSRHATFMRSVSPLTYKLYSHVFPLALSLKPMKRW